MMRIVIFSEINSEFGYMFLKKLLKIAFVQIVGLVTGPDGKLCSYYINDEVQYNLKAIAMENGIEVFQPENINVESAITRMRMFHADYYFIVNYQTILRREVFSIANKMSIVFHPSLLPEYAGLAPFYWIARQGETRSGVSAIKISEDIDSGEIVEQIPIILHGNETALWVRKNHFEMSLLLLDRILHLMRYDSFTFREQDMSKRTYYSLPSADDYRIDLSLGSDALLKIIRAGYRHPGAFYTMPNGTKIIILEANCFSREFVTSQIGVCPGCIFVTDDGLYLCCKDGVLKVQSIEFQGKETKLDAKQMNNLIPFFSGTKHHDCLLDVSG